MNKQTLNYYEGKTIDNVTIKKVFYGIPTINHENNLKFDISYLDSNSINLFNKNDDRINTFIFNLYCTNFNKKLLEDGQYILGHKTINNFYKRFLYEYKPQELNLIFNGNDPQRKNKLFNVGENIIKYIISNHEKNIKEFSIIIPTSYMFIAC